MRLTAQIICDILKAGMKLRDDQIWIYNQRRAIPEDKRLYVVVGVMGMRPYGNTNQTLASSAGMTDNLAQYIEETVSVDLMSYTTEAIERVNEVLGSLRTTYAEQIYEELALKVFPIPSTINDVSENEGAAVLYRIAITLTVLRRYDMIASASYYDNITQGTIDLIE